MMDEEILKAKPLCGVSNDKRAFHRTFNVQFNLDAYNSSNEKRNKQYNADGVDS